MESESEIYWHNSHRARFTVPEGIKFANTWKLAPKNYVILN